MSTELGKSDTGTDFYSQQGTVRNLETTRFRWPDFSLGLTLLFFVFCYVFLKQVKFKKGHNFCRRKTFEDFPGPPSLPVIGILHHIIWPKQDIFTRVKILYEKYRKYGIIQAPIFFQKYAVLCKPSYIQAVLSSRDSKYLNKPSLYKLMDTVSSGLVIADYPLWNKHRPIISRLFSYNGLQYQLKKTNFHTQNMIKSYLAKDGNKMKENNTEVFQSIIYAALDNILDVIMDMGVASPEDRHRLHINLEIVKSGKSRQFKEPWLLLPPVWWFHPLRMEIKMAEQEVREFIDKMVNIYKREKGKQCETTKPDIATKLSKPLMEEMLDAGMNAEEIFQETLTVIYAGHESSAFSAAYLLMQLSLNPEIQKRCREEVDQFFERKLENGEAASSIECDLTVADLNGLEYLDRCVKESLRLAPIIPIFARRLDAPLELEDDIRLDSGTNVVFAPWLMHRDPDVFPDPERYNPDRFLPEECEKRHKYSYLPFSAGLRNCIGWKSGLLSVKLIAAFFLRYFEVSTENKWEELEFVFDITLTTKQPIKLNLKKRQNIL